MTRSRWSLPSKPEAGTTGHVADHIIIARQLWLLTALCCLLLLNVIALWVIAT